MERRAAIPLGNRSRALLPSHRARRDVGLAFDEKAATYHVDELLLTCPARPFTTLLNASFEQGADGITPVVAAGAAQVDVDVP